MDAEKMKSKTQELETVLLEMDEEDIKGDVQIGK